MIIVIIVTSCARHSKHRATPTARCCHLDISIASSKAVKHLRWKLLDVTAFPHVALLQRVNKDCYKDTSLEMEATETKALLATSQDMDHTYIVRTFNVQQIQTHYWQMFLEFFSQLWQSLASAVNYTNSSTISSTFSTANAACITSVDYKVLM